jgi:hypothetical protein
MLTLTDYLAARLLLELEQPYLREYVVDVESAESEEQEAVLAKPRFPCSQCPANYSHRSGLRRHVRTSHVQCSHQ